MEIQRTLIDREFDRYALSTDGVQKHEAQLSAPVLEALDAAKTTRKAQWDARVHHNSLIADPFRTAHSGTSVAYFVDANFQIVEVIWEKPNCLHSQPIFQLPPSQRKENVSLQVAGLGLIAVCDGAGAVRVLKSPTAPNTAWRCVYEFCPVHGQSPLILQAAYDESTQRISILLAEALAGTDKEASFRLWLANVSSSSSGDSMSMDVDSENHTVSEILIASSLPDFISFVGNDLVLLVEGSYDLKIGSASTTAPAASAPASTVDVHHATKRHHDEAEEDMDVDEVLSKVPRAGIGYHGDISDVKHAHELAHDIDFSIPLQERFRKSSIPYSSLDEPLHSTSSEAVRSPSSQAREGPLEVPTPDTILGGFEECDDLDPNAKAAILLIDTGRLVVQDKLDVNCRIFRYLGKGDTHSSLLFQNDVHGLIFSLTVVASRLRLTHTGTFPAFGFVQASKQDKKYLTFQSRFAAIGEFERRVFVYHSAPPGQEKSAHVLQQNVVEVGDHQLLGMCAIGSAIFLLSPHHVYVIEVGST